MTTAEKIARVDQVCAAYVRLDQAFDALHQAVGFTENPLHEAAWKVFELYCDAVSREIGDTGTWISWFINDNRMGLRGFEAGGKGRMRPIKTVADLVAVIEEEA